MLGSLLLVFLPDLVFATAILHRKRGWELLKLRVILQHAALSTAANLRTISVPSGLISAMLDGRDYILGARDFFSMGPIGKSYSFLISTLVAGCQSSMFRQEALLRRHGRGDRFRS